VSTGETDSQGFAQASASKLFRTEFNIHKVRFDLIIASGVVKGGCGRDEIKAASWSGGDVEKNVGAPVIHNSSFCVPEAGGPHADFDKQTTKAYEFHNGIDMSDRYRFQVLSHNRVWG
jgi:hypothetical protein